MTMHRVHGQAVVYVSIALDIDDKGMSDQEALLACIDKARQEWGNVYGTISKRSVYVRGDNERIEPDGRVDWEECERL